MKKLKEMSKKEIRKELSYFQKDLGEPEKGFNLWRILRRIHYFLALIIELIDHDTAGKGSSD